MGIRTCGGGPELVIDGSRIADDTDCYVIAELGHNHGGDVECCKAMISAAKAAGASAVKLQKRANRTLFTSGFFNSAYGGRNAFAPTYGEHREALEFGFDEYVELKQHAAAVGITFFATAFDHESADFLARLDIPAFKIASGDLRTLSLIEHVASFGKPVILSTGASEIEDVRAAVDCATRLNPNVAVLQCTAIYPAQLEELDLAVIGTYRREFSNVIVGWSAHDDGVEMAVAAYALGARILEKHFTLDRNARGTDHSFSLDPELMADTVRLLANTRTAMGSSSKRMRERERAALLKMGKKLVAARNLQPGHIITANDVVARSPGDGLQPQFLSKVVGQRLTRALETDDDIKLELLEPVA